MSTMPRDYIERRAKNPTSAGDYEKAMAFYEQIRKTSRSIQIQALNIYNNLSQDEPCQRNSQMDGMALQ